MNKIFLIIFFSICNLFFLIDHGVSNDDKIKIGLLVPLTGDNAEIGKQITEKKTLRNSRKSIAWSAVPHAPLLVS